MKVVAVIDPGKHQVKQPTEQASLPGSSHKLNTEERKILESRAARPFSATPRAFLKWAGSKRLLLSHLIEILPAEIGTYYEPFLGSGSLFFLLRPKKAALSDRCGPLIETFSAVRDNVSSVIRHLRTMVPDVELYYGIRSSPSRGLYKRAAEFIYLNKTCWNGLYRVNSSGCFNVPYGRPKSTVICDSENLRACALALRAEGVTLAVGDFAESLANALPGDLVYLDPPYVTTHTDNGFRDYNETLFSWKDQERLARMAQELVAREVSVIVSNANHPEIISLYDGFSARSFERKSTLSSDMTKRGRASEALLFRCFPTNGAAGVKNG